ADLEDSPRGIYCGTVGYLSPGGAFGPRARFNVAIRTAVHDGPTGATAYGVGGGITWDSRAAGEYEETVAKARVLTSRRPAFRLVETLLHDPGSGYRRLEEHLRRLAESAAYHRFACDVDPVMAALDREAVRFPAKIARVRLLLDRRGRIEAAGAPLSVSPDPVSLALDRDHPVDPSDPFLFHKTTLRAPYEEASARFPDADDVVLVNIAGDVTETTVSNLAVLLDGTWLTPPLSAGLLPGCERAALLADGTLVEGTIQVDRLRDADGLAVLNSVRGWRRAVLG
ncbi:MAG: aminotransferase class IV, partial [Actinomycetota bacterium]